MNKDNKTINRYNFNAALPFEIEVKPLHVLHGTHQGLFTTPHRINFYDVIWFQKGNPVCVVDFKRIEVKPNSLLFINKNQVHFYEDFNDCDGWVLLFTDTFFSKSVLETRFLSETVLFNDLLNVPYFELNVGDNTLPDLFVAIQNELKTDNDPSKYLILQNLLFVFLLQAERAYRKHGMFEIKKGVDLEIAIMFRDLVDKHFAQQRGVHFYASQLNATEKVLQRSTAHVFGKSPKEYINERLVLEAKRLLLHSQSNTKEIAFDLGFDEPTNFIKYFRKYTGKTPIEFRETYFPS
ncbi:MAG: AraC family transcriptional regulator [Saprospiraceae bacterium]|nr:AraC family transcriptional regulator [Saprospiraceae bacterium]